jgi:hypothetical protein
MKPHRRKCRVRRAHALCYIDGMRPVRGFFFGYFWFSSASGGREIRAYP